MARAILLGQTGGMDTDGLTATPDTVLAPYTFGGSGSDEPQTGKIQTIPAQTITPKTTAQTVTGERYLGGNITVPGFSMPAANIVKKGSVVNIYGQKVTGTYKELRYYSTYIGPLFPNGSQTMQGGMSGQLSRTFYTYTGTVPSGVTLVQATSVNSSNTSAGSFVNFGMNNALNMVFLASDINQFRLYPAAINSYRYQSGTTFKIPLSTYSGGDYYIFLFGYYN